MMRSGRDAAGENSSRRNRLRYSRLRADLRSITNLDMIDNTHLACQRHIFAYSCATGNPCLSRDDGIFPNHHVVGNLHEIVNLRSEEHTSELQSHSDLVCRLLLEKKKTKAIKTSRVKIMSIELMTNLTT